MAINKKLFIKSAGGITPSDNFSVDTWTGDNTNPRTITTGIDNDFVWIKTRNQSFSHNLFDSVRGAGNFLRSDSSNAQGSASDLLKSFTSTGFTIGNGGDTNGTSNTYVSWSWKGGGAASSNSDGSITSSVSANTAANQSIVKYTGNSTQDATYATGLNSTSDLVITKSTSTMSWYVWSSELSTSNNYLKLESTAAASTTYTPLYPTNPVSGGAGLFKIGSDEGVNSSSKDYIAYHFANQPGYFKVGTYSGTNDATKAITGVGFQPRLVVIKGTNVATQWNVTDSVRGVTHPLEWNQSSAEQTRSDFLQSFDADGFTVGTDDAVSDSGRDFIYLAWA